MNRKSKILIAGYRSLIGLNLVQHLKKKGFVNLILADSSKIDFTNPKDAFSFFKKKRPDNCFIAPIQEGGIGANLAYPAELIYRNLAIQTNIIHSAWKAKVKKLIFFASSCVYPADCHQPMKEEYLLKGPLEPTNEPYAVAKIAGIKLCQAYNRQYGTRFISVIPATVYGPNDNFDLKTSHVISALLRKFHEAKVKNKSSVTIWGSGRPRREFIYAQDLAEASLFVMQHNNLVELINIGTGVDISIRKLAELVKRVVGFRGELKFDIHKPDGVRRKVLDVSWLSLLGWKAKTDLLSGLKHTYSWYLSSTSGRVRSKGSIL
ncbi:MAG: GDP-L-fucose synthase [Omnitrophica WOR_2 bacterium SM23_29]|nr:MAG: GDP-L-fucose synthase [Omnitrophica WOR_2 bacterium SM23_29]